MKFFRFSVLVCLGGWLFVLVHAAHDFEASPPCQPALELTSTPTIAACVPSSDANSLTQVVALPSDSAAVSSSFWLAQSNSTAALWSFNLVDRLQHVPIPVLGILASLIAGLATGIGALPMLLPIKISDRLQGALLGFAAGVMLAATSFSLLLPSIEWVTAEGGSPVYAAGVAVGGTLMGSGFIWLTDRTLPFERLIQQSAHVDVEKLKGIWLFIIAIAIHNFPEGLAIGVGFGGGNIGNGLALAIGIGLQNLPEGLAVALALLTQNYGRWNAFWIAFLTGLLEPLGGFVGVGIITLGEALLPWGLAFAAGAMLFVIGDEVIPEAQYLAPGRLATAGIVIGFIVMMFLDVALGG